MTDNDDIIVTYRWGIVEHAGFLCPHCETWVELAGHYKTGDIVKCLYCLNVIKLGEPCDS